MHTTLSKSGDNRFYLCQYLQFASICRRQSSMTFIHHCAGSKAILLFEGDINPKININSKYVMMQHPYPHYLFLKVFSPIFAHGCHRQTP